MVDYIYQSRNMGEKHVSWWQTLCHPILHRCISLKYDFYKGTRRMKLLDSNEIRQLRDICIFEVNGMEVYM